MNRRFGLPNEQAVTRSLEESAPQPEPALVIVDFDDTLVDTAPRFQRARREFFARLMAAGFTEEQILRMHNDEVDPGMVRRYGLGPFRLEPSFRETYRKLCLEARMTPDPLVADECAAIGHAVAGTPPLFEGALEALSKLDAALPTVIYTQSGHPEYQFNCVREAGVLDIIPPERVRVCHHKHAAEFRDALAHFGVDEPEMAWMVGNSMRSDINPALSNGAGAILVEVEDPWEYDQVEPVSDAYITVNSFPHAVGFLLGGKPSLMPHDPTRR
jgi:putative hydrolase of the HAD superfamily